jgi:hypothetical protein
MTKVHYFQRFSQRENVHTNNTLLLLSRIQVADPRLLRSVLGQLFADLVVAPEGLDVGVQFSQQTSVSSRTVPDGMLFQTSFRIVVETKLHQDFDTKQLTGHLSGFGNENTKILLILSPERVDNFDVPGAFKKRVVVVSRTFSDIIAACYDAKVHENLSLQELVEDYEEYCIESNLIGNEGDRMMAVAVGKTQTENRELRLYYEPTHRKLNKYRYIGLYWDKSIRAIGEIENMVCANLPKNGKLLVKEHDSAVTPEQKERIRKMIELTEKQRGWSMRSDFRFFLVKDFVDTSFKKTGSGGIVLKKYFSLREVLKLKPPTDLPDIQAIAKDLEKFTFE